MNILTNGLQAIVAKQTRSGNDSITIATRDIEDDKIEISIKDTGIGMTDEVKHRVFEPFFTTKDVGEGTGLGMAIVFKIIEKHYGKISINSSPGNGAEFILTLPHTQPIT
jgi:signal transduction histidine kinase